MRDSWRPVRQSESDLQKLIIGWLRTNGIFCWRNNSTGIFDPRTGKFRSQVGVGAMKGVPDIIGILPGGRFLGIEVKGPKGVLSNEQRAFIDKATCSGALCFVAKSIEDVKQCKEITRFFQKSCLKQKDDTEVGEQS